MFLVQKVKEEKDKKDIKELDEKNKGIKCNHPIVRTDFNDFGQWDVCMVCGQIIEGSFSYFNHYDGEDHVDDYEK